jgi:hypothetical protein
MLYIRSVQKAYLFTVPVRDTKTDPKKNVPVRRRVPVRSVPFRGV